MKMINNSELYWEFIRVLRNDPLARQSSMNSKEIMIEEHKAYMKTYGDQYYICTVRGIPAGYVGVDQKGYISVAVSSEFRRAGVGKFMIKYITEKYKDCKLYATVRNSNKASLALFESCSFEYKFYILENKVRSPDGK